MKEFSLGSETIEVIGDNQERHFFVVQSIWGHFTKPLIIRLTPISQDGLQNCASLADKYLEGNLGRWERVFGGVLRASKLSTEFVRETTSEGIKKATVEMLEEASKLGTIFI